MVINLLFVAVPEWRSDHGYSGNETIRQSILVWVFYILEGSINRLGKLLLEWKIRASGDFMNSNPKLRLLLIESCLSGIAWDRAWLPRVTARSISTLHPSLYQGIVPVSLRMVCIMSQLFRVGNNSRDNGLPSAAQVTGKSGIRPPFFSGWRMLYSLVYRRSASRLPLFISVKTWLCLSVYCVKWWKLVRLEYLKCLGSQSSFDFHLWGYCFQFCFSTKVNLIAASHATKLFSDPKVSFHISWFPVYHFCESSSHLEAWNTHLFRTEVFVDWGVLGWFCGQKTIVFLCSVNFSRSLEFTTATMGCRTVFCIDS